MRIDEVDCSCIISASVSTARSCDTLASLASSVVSCLFSIRASATDWPLGHSIIKLVKSESPRDVAETRVLRRYYSKDSVPSAIVRTGILCSQVMCRRLLHLRRAFCQVLSCSAYQAFFQQLQVALHTTPLPPLRGICLLVGS